MFVVLSVSSIVTIPAAILSKVILCVYASITPAAPAKVGTRLSLTSVVNILYLLAPGAAKLGVPVALSFKSPSGSCVASSAAIANSSTLRAIV